MSDSVWPYGQQPTRLLHPQDSLVKNTGVGCHFLIHMRGNVGSKPRSRLGIRTFLVARWIWICLTIQGTRVASLVWEYSSCRGTAASMCHKYWARALGSARHSYWACVLQLLKPACPRGCTLKLLSPRAATIEDVEARACAPWQKKPPQWETHASQLESSLRSLNLEKAQAQQQKAQHNHK